MSKSVKGIPIKVDVDLMRSCNNRLTDSVKQSIADTAFKLMTPYVPMDTGTLAFTVDVNPKEVHYKSNYAYKQYNGVNFNFDKEKHKLATARWDEAMMVADGDKLLKAARKFIKRG